MLAWTRFQLTKTSLMLHFQVTGIDTTSPGYNHLPPLYHHQHPSAPRVIFIQPTHIPGLQSCLSHNKFKLACSSHPLQQMPAATLVQPLLSKDLNKPFTLGCPTEVDPFVLYTHHQLLPSSTNHHVHAPSTSTTHCNFASIFNTTLESYKHKTKKDLALHLLLPSLQSCNSPKAILTILQEQIPASDLSQNHNDCLTNWVNPTMNVLLSFSEAIGKENESKTFMVGFIF